MNDEIVIESFGFEPVVIGKMHSAAEISKVLAAYLEAADRCLVRSIGIPTSLLTTADPSELCLAIEQPAPAKPSKFHDDISPQEWVKACRTVMTPKWMEY